MEKFSQFRDKGSGIAPFLPIPTEPAGIYLPFHAFLFLCRIPILAFFVFLDFVILQWLPIGTIGWKASLWCLLGVPGIWWIDLQIDGVKKGSLAQHNARLPDEGSVIAASSASPIDALYLAAIFDPVFAACYPSTKLVQPISLFKAVARAFAPPQSSPPAGANLVELESYIKQNSNRVIVLFPECTTSNGRGILPLSPSLSTVPARTKVFPVNLRYTAPDITTPLPNTYFTFFWNLCSKPTHCIRIRIAEAVFNTARRSDSAKTTASNGIYLESLISDGVSDAETLVAGDDGEAHVSREERMFLDRVAEALARLGRVKRVGLGVKDKQDFVAMWTKSRRR